MSTGGPSALLRLAGLTRTRRAGWATETEGEMDLSYRLWCLIQRKARIKLWQYRAKGNLKIHRGGQDSSGGFVVVTKDRWIERMVRAEVLYSASPTVAG